MSQSPDAWEAPDLAKRLALRNRPPLGHVMLQQWSNLLFLHWEYPVEEIQCTLPPGLMVDTFEGKAYLGIVPFFMRNIRPRFCPSISGISNFLELNLRTYVRDRRGNTGVWFYSLDANQRLAVFIARQLFHLPYVFADMRAECFQDGTIRYRSQRRGSSNPVATCSFEYAAGAPLPEPQPGSLEFFLVERYLLFSVLGQRLMRGRVWHQPYAVCQPKLTAWDAHLCELNGFAQPRRAPDHVLMSAGVDVRVFPLERA
jgi:hypothetical protein